MAYDQFSGDVSLEYGGAFFDLSTFSDGYVSAVRVTDLDSGCGFNGACLIERIVICGCDDEKRIRESLKCCGVDELPDDETARQLCIAEALMSYGHYDPDDGPFYFSKNSEIVQCEADGPMIFDGWKATKRLRGTTLEAYVKSQWL